MVQGRVVHFPEGEYAVRGSAVLRNEPAAFEFPFKMLGHQAAVTVISTARFAADEIAHHTYVRGCFLPDGMTGKRTGKNHD